MQDPWQLRQTRGREARLSSGSRSKRHPSDQRIGPELVGDAKECLTSPLAVDAEGRRRGGLEAASLERECSQRRPQRRTIGDAEARQELDERRYSAVAKRREVLRVELAARVRGQIARVDDPLEILSRDESGGADQ